MRGFRDRDYLRTPEGYLFCVLGSVHPADRAIAYLKYVPDPSGMWGRADERLRRALRNYTMHDLLETFQFLEQHHPEYLYDSSVMGIKISAVPVNRISAHFKPEEKLLQLSRMERPDDLQRKAFELASLISDESGVPLRFFGVTGSILLDIHRDFSDIDLTVYGRRASESVKEALKQIYSEEDHPIRRFDKERIREWCQRRARMHSLSYEEAARIFEKRWNRGLFVGIAFSIHPVRLEEEVHEKYGDRIYRPRGMIKIEARVSDSSEADFLPSIYKVEEVRVLEGEKVTDITEVTSYEGLYGGLAEEGEKILSYGKLETIIDKRTGEQYHRVLVGSKEARGSDYIKPITG
jgi:hypothetical protein